MLPFFHISTSVQPNCTTPILKTSPRGYQTPVLWATCTETRGNWNEIETRATLDWSLGTSWNPGKDFFPWALDSHWDVRSLHLEFSSQLTWLLTWKLHKHFGTGWWHTVLICSEYDSCRQPPRFWRDVARSATNSFPIAGEPAANQLKATHSEALGTLDRLCACVSLNTSLSTSILSTLLWSRLDSK